MHAQSPRFRVQHHGNQMVGITYDPNIQEVEAEELGVQGHPQLHGEFKARLGYMRHSLGEEQRKIQKDSRVVFNFLFYFNICHGKRCLTGLRIASVIQLTQYPTQDSPNSDSSEHLICTEY